MGEGGVGRRVVRSPGEQDLRMGAFQPPRRPVLGVLAILIACAAMGEFLVWGEYWLGVLALVACVGGGYLARQ